MSDFEKKTGNLTRWVGAHEQETADGPIIGSVLVLEVVEVPEGFTGDRPPVGAPVMRVVFRKPAGLMGFIDDMLTAAKTVWPEGIIVERMTPGSGNEPVH